MVKAGDAAPTFRAPADSGEEVSLGDLKGKTVVLYFYPKDDTPGCTVEANEFTALAAEFAAAGATVLGVSRDTVNSHCRFRDKYGLKVTLLSDPELGIHKAYGAWGEKTMYGKKVEGVLRSTFVIDGDGVVQRAYANVKAAGHAAKVLADLKG
jgi:thioredoxin-dependent peroxiredoxin